MHWHESPLCRETKSELIYSQYLRLDGIGMEVEVFVYVECSGLVLKGDVWPVTWKAASAFSCDGVF